MAKFIIFKLIKKTKKLIDAQLVEKLSKKVNLLILGHPLMKLYLQVIYI